MKWDFVFEARHDCAGFINDSLCEVTPPATNVETLELHQAWNTPFFSLQIAARDKKEESLCFYHTRMFPTSKSQTLVMWTLKYVKWVLWLEVLVDVVQLLNNIKLQNLTFRLEIKQLICWKFLKTREKFCRLLWTFFQPSPDRNHIQFLQGHLSTKRTFFSPAGARGRHHSFILCFTSALSYPGSWWAQFTKWKHPECQDILTLTLLC